MSDYLDFVEEKLELGFDYGAVGGMRFKTTIIKKGDKQEQRNVDWWLPLGRWQLGERTLLESDFEKINEVIELRDFHANRKGSKQGFRFKDWSDYKAINNPIGTADGQQTQWQLKKIYFAGTFSTFRPITKPVEGTVTVYLNNIEAVEGWTVNYSNGVLTFDVAPPPGTIINASFEFDIPVWFENDKFSWTLEGYQKDPQTEKVAAIYRLGNLPVQEGRIPLALPWYHLDSVPQEFDATLDLGIILNTVGENQFDTSKETLASGFVRRDANLSAPEVIFKIGQKTYNQEELDQLLGFFWNCKGRAGKFALKINGTHYKVRFDTDFLQTKFLIYDLAQQAGLFSINNLTLFGFSEIIPLPELPNFTIETEFIDFGLGNSPNTQPLTTNYVGTGGSGGGGGLSGAGGSGGSGSGGSGGAGGSVGFSFGLGTIPLELTGFTPLVATELNGYPVIIGKVGITAVYLALPIFPYTGQMQLHYIGYLYVLTSNFVWRVRNGRAYFSLYVEGGSGQEDGIVILTVNPDFTYETTFIYQRNNSGGFMPIYASDRNIHFIASFQSQYLTGNVPSTMGLKSANNPWLVPGIEEKAFYAPRDYIDTRENDNWVRQFEWGDNIINYYAFGDFDNNYENGAFLLNNVSFCSSNLDLTAPAACDPGDRVRHVATFERIDDTLYFRGAFPYQSEFNITRGQESYYKRNLIFNHRYIFNIPTGTLLDLTSLDSLPSNLQSVQAGENFIVIMYQNNGWKIAFANTDNA